MAEFHYGGQALIEGVMIRGRSHLAIAVRRPDGTIHLLTQPLGKLVTGRLRQLPLTRGVVVLGETLALGMKALLYSAQIALGEEEGQEFPQGLAWGTVAFALVIGVGLFFVLPLLLARLLSPLASSPLANNLLEGALRLVIFVLYLKVVGLFGEIRRVFAYHGAEHQVVNAYESGRPLELEAVRDRPTAHTRCGTSFILVVLVVAVLVFSLLGKPPLWLGIIERILLIPVIAVVSYELLQWSARHYRNGLVRALFRPGLLLQGLTTRPPDEGMREVALTALKGALEADSSALRAGTPPGGALRAAEAPGGIGPEAESQGGRASSPGG